MSFFLEPWSYPSVHRREKLSLPDADLKKKKKKAEWKIHALKVEGENKWHRKNNVLYNETEVLTLGYQFSSWCLVIQI